MKKSKILIPALSIASVSAIVAPIATLTSCAKNTQQVLSYDEAFTWVKNNYGTESKQYTVNKTESAWAFAGWINFYGSTTDRQNMTTYLYNHLDDLIIYMTNVEEAKVKSSEVDRGGATYDPATSKNICALGDIAFTSNLLQETPVISEKETTLQTLSEANFEQDMNYYFTGAFKHNAEYIVNGKNLTVHGTLSYVQEDPKAAGNYDNLKLPECYITYDANGRLSEFKFDFQQMTIGTYAYENTTSSSGYSFFLTPGGFIDAKYSFKTE